MSASNSTPSATKQKASVIENICAILQADLGLKNYEAETLAERLNEPNFYEFWFSGDKSGSIKVYLDQRGLPYVTDQYNTVNLKKLIPAVNAKIQALFF